MYFETKVRYNYKCTISQSYNDCLKKMNYLIAKEKLEEIISQHKEDCFYEKIDLPEKNILHVKGTTAFNILPKLKSLEIWVEKV